MHGPATTAASAPRRGPVTPVSGAPLDAHGSHPLPGSRLAWRFVDGVAAGRAVRSDGQDAPLAAAWAALADHPQRALLPYSRLAGEAAYRAVSIAFADADVADYPSGDPRHRRPPKSLDPVWNRTRAVYLSRAALFVPTGTKQLQRVTVPQGGRLETSIAALAPAGGAGLEGRVTVDGEVVARVPFARDEGEVWRPLAVDLARFAGRTVEVGFEAAEAVAPPARRRVTTATGEPPATAALFFATPTLWAIGGGAPGPNVVVILVDTLRADAALAMPHLAALARRGARFDQAITAATWTRPSLLALYGGDLPTAVGQAADEMIPDDADRRRFYRGDPPLLPRLLAARGWRSSAIGNNFFLLAYPQIGLDMGFEEVDDVRHPVLDTPAITRAALRYFDENRDRAFLLHLHYDAPHWPYTPPPEYLARARALAGTVGDAALWRDPDWAKYLAEALYADDAIGRVVDGLAERGLLDRTLVVVLGDHGEVFDPAHAQTVVALGQPTLHHHGWSAYDEILRVPLVVAPPAAGAKGAAAATGAAAPTANKAATGGRVVASQVRTLDLARTLLDVLGVDAALPARGRSLLPLVEGASEPDRPALVEGQDVRALRAEGWLYLARPDPRLVVDGRERRVDEELYDLARDPQQHHDLARDPSAASQLARMRARATAEAPSPPEVPTPVYHLALAPVDEAADVPGQAPRLHRLSATVRAAGRVTVRGVTDAPRSDKRAGEGSAVAPIDAHAVRVELVSGGDCQLAVEPPEAALTVEATLDGLPLPPRRLLVGEFALPLADGPTIAGPLLTRLDAPRPPDAGHRGDALLWRDRNGATLATPATAAGKSASEMDEVNGMMQRWGYAQSPSKPPQPQRQ